MYSSDVNEIPAYETLRTEIEKFPTDPGVYLFKDRSGRVLYVGKARSLRVRARSYLRDGADGRHHIQFLLRRAASVEYIVTVTEQEALILENNLIKKHRPRYNVVFKDDKTYVNLRLNVGHPYPRLTVVRRPRRDDAQYFGPFASAGSVRSTLRTLGRIFPMRTCTDSELASRTRPCLYYYIKRCPAPCVGKVDAQEYAETVRRVTMFLKGRGNELLKSLRDRMDLLAAERRYEEAARIRDQIYSVQAVLEKQRIISPQKAERDVFAVYRRDDRMVIQTLNVQSGEVSGGASFHFANAILPEAEQLASFINQYYQSKVAVPEEVIVGVDLPEQDTLAAFLSERRKKAVRIVRPQRGERKQLLDLALTNAMTAFAEGGASERNRELLEDLQDLLSLQRYPRRIECFDISNIQGQDAVGSGVTFIDGEPAKAQYRNYRIRTVEGSDDYAMMREVLERRLARGLREGDLPDLLLIDGGRGQLGVALGVVERLGADDVDVVAIAKVRGGNGRRKVRGKERIYTPALERALLLEGNSPALYLLERIRDEAHRFAITHHRRRRGRRISTSKLDGIPGIGPVLKQRLLAEFGSVARIRTTPIELLTAVPGMSERLARAVRDALA